MVSSTEENYLKAIFKISEKEGAPVSTNSISGKMSTSAASVSDMIKRLADKDLVLYEKWKGVRLTDSGRKIATNLIRKHRIWEVFLVDKLNFAWDEVHPLAEELEHIHSDKLINSLDEFLGFPKFDPHGDPIPNIDGKFTIRNQVSLLNLTKGDKGIVVGVKEHDTPFLQYLNQIKIKLGTKNDIEIVTELRKHSDAIFRIDANCGWTADEAIENSFKLKELGVEFLEQPLKANDIEGAKKLYENSALPIIADESCIVESDVEKCVGLFHGVNVKLTKCGGLTPGKRMLENARRLGLKTMVGCMTESSVGISAIGHLLPLLDYVDMDGGLLLKKDIAEGVIITDGVVSYSNLNGTGVTLL